MSEMFTCKTGLQLLTLVGDDVVVGRNEGAAGAVQAQLESTVPVCGHGHDEQMMTRLQSVSDEDGREWFTHLCGSAIHSRPRSRQRSATRPPSVFVPPYCQCSAELETSGLCALESVDRQTSFWKHLQRVATLQMSIRLHTYKTLIHILDPPEAPPPSSDWLLGLN